MMPRKLRLSRAHFASQGPETRATSPHFSVTLRRTKGPGGLAAIVSKKVEKTSVARHRLKRRIFATLRAWHQADTALIVYARTGAGALPYQALEHELTELLHRVSGAMR